MVSVRSVGHVLTGPYCDISAPVFAHVDAEIERTEDDWRQRGRSAYAASRHLQTFRCDHEGSAAQLDENARLAFVAELKEKTPPSRPSHSQA